MYSYEICTAPSYIKPIYFSIDTFNINVSTYEIPSQFIEVINSVSYLKLYCSSDKYKQKGGDGSYLENTSTGSVFVVRTYRDGFDATFDYGEYELVRLLKAIADNTRKTKEFITVIDYVGKNFKDRDFSTKVGIILPSSIQHGGITTNPLTNKDYVESFNLSFVSKDNTYV